MSTPPPSPPPFNFSLPPPRSLHGPWTLVFISRPFYDLSLSAFYISPNLHLCPPIYLCPFLYISLFPLYPSVSPFYLYPFLYLSVSTMSLWPPIHLLVPPYISLSPHISISPPLYFSFSPLIYLSVPYVYLCHAPITPSENLLVLFLKSSSSKISLILPKYLRFSSKISLDSY